MGNKIALEVKVSHACEYINIKDFEDHNYPIIEITLNENMQFLKELRKEQFNDNDLEKYYNFILDKFSKNIYGKAISNPVKIKYHKRVIKKLTTENQNIEKKFKSALSKKEKNLNSLEKELNKTEQDKQLLLKENAKLKNKSFFTKLGELFK